MESLVHIAMSSVEDTNLHSNHVCIITRGKKILTTNTNDDGNRILGISVPTRHAEMNALDSLYKTNPPRKKYYEKFRHIRY